MEQERTLVEKIEEQLENRYKVKDKGRKVVIEELKQSLAAISAQLTWYEARAEEYVQDRMFHKNQLKLFERFEKKDKNNDIKPESQECENLQWNMGPTNQT